MNLAYNTTTDADGRTLYCFTTPDGTESPTLYVNPGDLLVVNVVNNLPAPAEASAMQMATNAKTCGASMMDASSVNIHYHGTNVSPSCHADEVIHTLINAGQSFTYAINFPASEPPGLYWYHPHVHGISEPALQGGASGAVVVEGIENIQPSVATLPERVLLVRDQPVAGNPDPGGAIPSWDVTLNYIPISYPTLTPAVIQMQYGKQEFWRVANQSADTILDIQVLYDGTPQTLMLVALDGVPVGSQDGARQGKLLPVTDMRLPPAARAEFLLTGPAESVQNALFLTQAINTGPDGDNDTERTLARINGGASPIGTTTMPAVSTGPSAPLFYNLQDGPITAHRKLYFSENDDQTEFFITVDGQKPAVFSPDNKPAITTVQLRRSSEVTQ